MSPEWINGQDARKAFNFNKERLHELVACGALRSAKVGNGRSARRLYKADEIRAILERLASGETWAAICTPPTTETANGPGAEVRQPEPAPDATAPDASAYGYGAASAAYHQSGDPAVL